MDVLPIEQAYELAHRGAVVVRRPDRGLVRLTGEQRIWFLQNTVSNDVEGVEVGDWVASCFLTTKGKVVAHFRIGVLSEELWLDVDPPGTADLVDWFTRYRFRTKVEIEDRSPGSFTIIGPAAAERCGDGEVRLEDGAVLFGGRLGDVAALDVHAPEAPGWVSDLPVAGEELYEVLRLEAGIGRFGVDFGADTLPQEAGLTSIVSATKGCYVGQEVVARLHFRGHVNRVLRRLEISADVDPAALPGTEVRYEDGKVGAVTSAARSPRAGVIGLGMVRVTVPEGADVELPGAGSATVGPVPEGTKTVSSRSPRPAGGR